MGHDDVAPLRLLAEHAARVGQVVDEEAALPDLLGDRGMEHEVPAAVERGRGRGQPGHEARTPRRRARPPREAAGGRAPRMVTTAVSAAASSMPSATMARKGTTNGMATSGRVAMASAHRPSRGRRRPGRRRRRSRPPPARRRRAGREHARRPGCAWRATPPRGRSSTRAIRRASDPPGTVRTIPDASRRARARRTGARVHSSAGSSAIRL